MKRILLFAFAFFFLKTAFGQSLQPLMMKPKKPIICYANPADQHTVVEEPEAYRIAKKEGRTKSANIIVTYNNFSNEARTAFQAAVDIWASLIQSDVPIRITANWQPLGTNVLGSAIWGTVHANFPGAQRVNTWYPAALAEKMAGEPLNADSDPDIVANFNSTFNWYLGTSPTGVPASGQYDFVTVVLHEIGHGLGFVDSYSVSDAIGTVGIGSSSLPMIYDHQIENLNGQNLFRSFANGTAQLKTELTSNNVFYNSPQVLANNGNDRARIYAPTTFDGGSSISHLNETTYPAGNINSLMTPAVGAVEKNHDPGPIVNAAFSDMGWKFTRIAHQPLSDTETITGSFLVKAIVTSDLGAVSNIKLVYNSGGADTEVTMTATGQPNEYQASVPATGAAATYRYYISANDNLNRTYTNPGKLIRSGQQTITQIYNTFNAGPDTRLPRITHAPRTFIQDSETSLDIAATISDNLGIELAAIQYKINGGSLQGVFMARDNENDSLYTASINVNALSIGDKLEYRIKAVDTSMAANVAYSPTTNFYTLNVVGLLATQESYSNNFNATTDDFFGDGFSIATPSGFTNGAMHSTHPYPEGTGFPDNRLNLTYQLKIPIRVKEQDALIRFDEIVLVEPGETGSVFGDDDFYDYVAVEGSVDGGLTWIVLEGYDARKNTDWLSRYNGSISGNNSTAVGDPTLFRSHTIDLKQKFQTGNEVAIRFRLFSDPFARGWGWAIDNLRIQTDETAPTILHDHVDFVTTDDPVLPLSAKVSDASGIKSLNIEYKVNEQAIQQYPFAVLPNVNEYSVDLQLQSLSPGDILSYRISATDSADNNALFPVDAFLKVVYVDLPEAIDEYVTDFNTTNTDFAGNFFTRSQPVGFTSAAIQSDHFYKVGMGLDTTSSFQYTLLKPIHVNESNPIIKFDEIVLIQDQAANVAFGTPAFNDFVIVEGSKDEGKTWKPFLNGYDATAKTSWQNAVANGSNGNISMFQTRLIDMLANGNFSANDDVLIRFRMFSDKTVNAWGWAIDNLSIQGLVTGAAETLSDQVSIYPNPVVDQLQVVLPQSAHDVNISVLDVTGRSMTSKIVTAHYNLEIVTIDMHNVSDGVYMIRLSSNDKTSTKKVIKSTK